jgi:hypothetical protein
LGGDGAFGFGAVDAGGFDLFEGSHCIIVIGRGGRQRGRLFGDGAEKEGQRGVEFGE